MSDYDYRSQIRAIEQSNAEMINSYFGSPNAKKSSGGIAGMIQNSVKNNDPLAGLTGSLSDYGLIKSGSYSKLVKAYYEKTGTASLEVSDSTKTLSMVKKDAQSLKSAADAFKSSDFEKIEKTTKNEDGTETTTKDYDRDTLYKKANQLVKSYNDMLDSLMDVENGTILKAGVRMTHQSVLDEDFLNKIGISVKGDNKLSIDEDTFKKADISKIKTAFLGSNSFASKISARASAFANTATNEVAKSHGGSVSYTPSGNYQDMSTSKLYDSLT